MRFFWKRFEDDSYRYYINHDCYIVTLYASNNIPSIWEENFNFGALIIPLAEQSKIINAKSHEYRWSRNNAKNIINMYLSGIFL